MSADQKFWLSILGIVALMFVFHLAAESGKLNAALELAKIQCEVKK